MPTITLGTRGSKLALAQTAAVVEALRGRWPDLDFETRVIRTTGDRDRRSALSAIAGRGVFTREIEDGLLRGDVDLAVHSAKDLPTDLAEGLTLAAFLPRADPRDAVVLANKLGRPQGDILDLLPEGAHLGTGSPRRRAQLLHRRPDLRFTELRGNLDTRLRKLEDEGLDGVVLAMAGLVRLGMVESDSEGRLDIRPLPLDVCLPAAGQGAIAVECRSDDPRGPEIAAGVDHGATRAAVQAERAALEALGGGCRVPLGVHAVVTGEALSIHGLVATADGSDAVRAEAAGVPTDPGRCGRELAARLRHAGADGLLTSS